MYYLNKVKGFYPLLLVLNLQIIIMTETLEIMANTRNNRWR